MRYLPAVAIAVGVSVAVCVGLYLTHDSLCLWGLSFVIFAPNVLPDEKTENKGSVEKDKKKSKH